MIVYNIPLVKNQEIFGDTHPVFNLSGASIEVIHISLKEQYPFISIDTAWHNERYGFDLPKSDIENYLLHYTAWQTFSEKNEDWCLIIEESIKIEASCSDIHQKIQSLDEEWDVYFPFDRFQIYEQEGNFLHQQNNSLINPNRQEYHDHLPFLLGFYWGSSIYFLSKKGALKLLQAYRIKQRVDDEIISLSTDEIIETFFDDVPWFNYNDQPKVRSMDRTSAIFNTIMSNSRWSVESKRHVGTLLKRISELAKNLNIDLILQGGTHLGHIRHGGIMPWDDDVDLGIEEKDLERFLLAVKDNDTLRYDQFIEKPTGIPFHKIWLQHGVPIEGHEYTFPFVDLWIFNRVGSDLVFKNGIICPNSAKYPFQDICFEGADFKITGNSIEVLDSRYRTWKNGIRVYNYHHSLEHNKGFPLRVEISVDENGRMIAPSLK